MAVEFVESRWASTGAINGDIFVAYIEQILAPTLKPGDIVVMDNLASHKVAGVARAIKAAKEELLYLPPNNPDLNPIEQTVFEVQKEIHKRKPRTKEQCDALCGECLDRFTPGQCRNEIRQAGYGSQDSN